MNIFDELFLFQRLDNLLRTRATGTPQQLASRLNVSERQTYRLLDRLREQGFPIAFCKASGTYYYAAPVKVRLDITVGDEQLLKITGGENKFDLFSSLTIFGSDPPDICSTKG